MFTLLRGEDRMCNSSFTARAAGRCIVGGWDTHQLYTCTFEVSCGSNVADIRLTLRLCISTRLRLRHATATLISYPEKAAWRQVLRADVYAMLYGVISVCSMKDVMRSVVDNC